MKIQAYQAIKWKLIQVIWLFILEFFQYVHRLGVSYPELTEMQARAIFQAAVSMSNQGVTVLPEIMVPLVGTPQVTLLFLLPTCKLWASCSFFLGVPHMNCSSHLILTTIYILKPENWILQKKKSICSLCCANFHTIWHFSLAGIRTSSDFNTQCCR